MNQPATRSPQELSAISKVDSLFKQYSKAISDALPKHLTPQRMMRVALTELRKTPKLQQCDAMSFLGAVVQESQLGLEPGGSLGHCYLVPYGKEVQLQLGYRGMIDLARRSGNIISIVAHCIYEGDEFSVEFGTGEMIKHIPKFKSSNMTHVYAIAKLKDGGIQPDVMSKGEVEYVRDTYSKTPKNGPWATAFDEMAKKTVVRRLFKMLPTSIEIREAISIDENDDQHNAKILDANYEVLPSAPDLGRYRDMADSSDAPMNTPQIKVEMEAERKTAINEFAKAVQGVSKVGGDASKILGMEVNEILKMDAATIMSKADILSLWEPAK